MRKLFLPNSQLVIAIISCIAISLSCKKSATSSCVQEAKCSCNDPLSIYNYSPTATFKFTLIDPRTGNELVDPTGYWYEEISIVDDEGLGQKLRKSSAGYFQAVVAPCHSYTLFGFPGNQQINLQFKLKTVGSDCCELAIDELQANGSLICLSCDSIAVIRVPI